MQPDGLPHLDVHGFAVDQRDGALWAALAGDGLYRSRDEGAGSTDGGLNWRQVKAIEQGAGPVAWAPSTPEIGYVVGFDGTLYKTSDGGRQWKAVSWRWRFFRPSLPRSSSPRRLERYRLRDPSHTDVSSTLRADPRPKMRQRWPRFTTMLTDVTVPLPSARLTLPVFTRTTAGPRLLT